MAIYKVVAEPVQSIIDVLEDALAEAKSGKVRVVALVCGLYDDQGRFTATTVSAGGPEALADPMVGALARMQYRLISGS